MHEFPSVRRALTHEAGSTIDDLPLPILHIGWKCIPQRINLCPCLFKATDGINVDHCIGRKGTLSKFDQGIGILFVVAESGKDRRLRITRAQSRFSAPSPIFHQHHPGALRTDEIEAQI